MKKIKVLCIGEILYDMLPLGPKEGGAPMNVALHLNKLGLDSSFCSRVGNDELGKSLKSFLHERGIDIGLLQIDPILPTSTVDVTLKSGQIPVFNIVDNVAWDNLEITPALYQKVKKADAIIYGTLASRHVKTYNTVFSLVKEATLRIIDVNLRPPYIDKNIVESLIRIADIVKLNDEELKIISGWNNIDGDEWSLTKWFADYFGCKILCVTKGAYGAFCYDVVGNNFYTHPGFIVNVADTVGSGDAFLAGFLFKYFEGVPFSEVIEFASATGALVASKIGGTPEYDIKEIEHFINFNQLFSN